MNKEDLDKILKLHKKWRNKEEGGVRANLSGMNLSGMNLSGLDLSETSLSGADLYQANLTDADLTHADLTYAYLSKADLTNANLYRANLYMSFVTNANLFNANLFKADLSEADLYGANLIDAALYDTHLIYTYLYGAKINWNSRWLVSELLFRDADNDSRRDAANIVRNNKKLCWDDFLAMRHPEQEWALNVLRTYLNPGEKHCVLGTRI